MDYLDKPDPQTFIAHHGIKGQKWGVRRFQNEDGSLTKAGKERYNEQNSPNSSDNSENQKFHYGELNHLPYSADLKRSAEFFMP